jgi:hypothetical protein
VGWGRSSSLRERRRCGELQPGAMACWVAVCPCDVTALVGCYACLLTARFLCQSVIINVMAR